MANWFCSVFNVVCVVKRLSSPHCRSELIDSALVVIVPGQKCEKYGKPAKTFSKQGNSTKIEKNLEVLS